MKIQEVFQRAEHDSITWNEAAEILGVDPRTVRRWKPIIEEEGFQGLLDKRTRKPSPKRVPHAHRTRVLKLYQELYHEWNVKHFHEQLRQYQIPYSYTWTKNLLQEAGLIQMRFEEVDWVEVPYQKANGQTIMLKIPKGTQPPPAGMF